MFQVSKKTATMAIGRCVLWLVIVCIGRGLVSVSFNRPWVNLIWEILSVAAFGVLIALPVLKSYRNGDEVPTQAKATTLPKPASPWEDELMGIPEPETISKETVLIRNSMVADITACLADTPYMWRWLLNGTVSLIEVYNANNRDEYGTGHLVIEDGRVVMVEVWMSGDNPLTCYPNHPLILAQREARMRIDVPVVRFMEATIPDAKWGWVSSVAGLITVTSASRKFKGCVAELKRAADGSISSINVRVEQDKFVRIRAAAPKAAPSKESAGSVAKVATTTTEKPSPKAPKEPTKSKKYAAKADVQGLKEVSATKSVLAAPAKKVEPIDVTLPEELEQHLLAPTDIPPVDDDRLKQAAALIAEDDASELNELAMAAEEEGEASFVKVWSEGIQTKKEAEYYAATILQHGTFEKAEVNAENQTIRFYLYSDVA